MAVPPFRRMFFTANLYKARVWRIASADKTTRRTTIFSGGYIYRSISATRVILILKLWCLLCSRGMPEKQWAYKETRRERMRPRRQNAESQRRDDSTDAAGHFARATTKLSFQTKKKEEEEGEQMYFQTKCRTVNNGGQNRTTWRCRYFG